MDIYKQFTFDAAHFLPNVPEGHKCRAMHGHTYYLTVFISGPVLEEAGWVIDFGDVKAICKPVLDRLDHSLLNDIPGLENPTAENVARWLWLHFKHAMPGLKKIELKETPTSGVIYEGD
ncbi:6-carboxytetrahydropterin synthase QueD [Mucilaginibacter sp. BJC16-A38]|uniref:6-carboxytetrahydropterin synthase QueD n=1 Tax=Mucilaginibacter phenanthrenivorans TaxID=1234842 RepID=UPI00215811BA|nr:6-carboxytetrahydropterin synthase QueD [Mucilaginibacter phenanthrenivorans]MCR8558141.1 6-carboxytetrahydropterin synthase QueD [Mucilaginibacter phenanthrenivorans]